MINEEYKAMLGEKSRIREVSEAAGRRRAEIGAENVFDFSIGNPNVPCPPDFTKAVIDLYETAPPHYLHGYSPSTGLPQMKEAVAQSLNARFGMDYEPRHIFPTAGATAAIAHAVRAVRSVTKLGDEVLTFAPFFPEYIPYIEGSGAKLHVVPADTDDFQVDFEAFERALKPNVAAVLINTPNNPSGAVYSEATLRELAAIMERKAKEYGHDIFLISDEPYREITFDGDTQAYPAKFYDNTLTCYSFSKSLSLPGERIGYVAVNPRATDADIMVPMFAQISRTIGHNCPSSTMQLAIARVIGETSDLSIYEKNMNLLYDALKDLGFDVVRPGGTFYIFPKTPTDDAMEFCRKAMEYDLFIVPSDSFGLPGYVRMSYCMETDQLERAIDRLKVFMHEQYGR
ncbi:MAG: pyridoxal phosphate-dependent aminotransferase [Bifidobacterium sp.]|nr:pyridoxal phosphate-dependent aminotransferase [Bifidobacterium sp.]